MQPQDPSSSPPREGQRPSPAPGGPSLALDPRQVPVLPASPQPLLRQPISTVVSDEDPPSPSAAAEVCLPSPARSPRPKITASRSASRRRLREEVLHEAPEQSRRSLRPRPTATEQPKQNPGRSVYTIGKGFRLEELHDLELRLVAMHTDPSVSSLCNSITQAAEQYLTLTHSANTGWGYTARCRIPPKTNICFYSGELRPKRLSMRSNHVIDLGTVIDSPLIVDGSPSSPSKTRPGSMQMVNHSCLLAQPSPEGPHGPNCVARHIPTADGLGLWVLDTARAIEAGEQLSFDYGGSFWSTGPHGPSRAGHELVRCKCSGARCPRDRWRWERPTHCVALCTSRAASTPRPSPSLRKWFSVSASAQDGQVPSLGTILPPDLERPSPSSAGVGGASTSCAEHTPAPPQGEGPKLLTHSAGPGYLPRQESARQEATTDNSPAAGGPPPLEGVLLEQDQEQQPSAATTGLIPANPEPLSLLPQPSAGADLTNPPPQRIITLNVGPVGIRESMGSIVALFKSTPAVVLIQEAKLPPSAVANLKRVAHKLLPHYCLFVGTLPKDGPSSQRHEVVTFVHCHLAARATLLDITRQTMDVTAASRSELLSKTQVLRTTDVQSQVNILWLNIYGFQASDPTRQEAQWNLIHSVVTRWQPQSDYVIIGGDFNASLTRRFGYNPDSKVHCADALARRFTQQLSLSVSAPSLPTWSNVEGSKASTLDFFLSKAITQRDGPHIMATCLSTVSASESPDPRHDHKAVLALLVEGLVSPLPPLEDMRAPVRLRMGSFHERREQWARLTQQRVEAVPCLESLNVFERLDRIKAAATQAAREVLGTTGGKLRPAIRFHSKESIRLLSLLRTVKAARRDILSRKDVAALAMPGTCRPSRAMRAMWDRGIVPSDGSFACLTDPHSEAHCDFTREWLKLLRDTTDQILVDLKKLRDNERKLAESQSRADAILRMYRGKGELRRFLHGSETQSPAPFLVSPLPDRVSFHCNRANLQALLSSIRSLDSRLRVSSTMDEVTVEDIPPNVLHRVLSTPGVSPGVTCTSRGILVHESADRLSCWEYKLALDGLATHTRCSVCLASSILPVPHAAGHSRGVDYFCTSCGAFREVHVDPEDYRSIDFIATNSVPRMPPDAPERLAKAISKEDLDWYLSTLPSHKAPGPDGIPYECLKFGPVCLKEAVFESVNAILTQSSPMPLDWKGGLIRYLFKTGDRADMCNYRPVCLQDTVYKVLSAVLTDRLYHISEKYGLLADTQEGFRRLRSTTRQAQSLQWAIEDAAQRKTLLCIAYLDFENAFNSIDHEALWQWLESLGIPDVDLLRSLYKHAFYTAEFPYGSTARVQLTRGKKQGDLISPLLFELVFNIYLLALEATSRGSIRLFRRPRVGRGFADDVAILASSKAQLQIRLDTTAKFCRWSGMRVKVNKSRLTAYDFASRKAADVSGIAYEGQELVILPPQQAFAYLGIRISLAGPPFRSERQHILDSVKQLRDQVQSHKYNLDQIVEPIQLVASSRFRYSAPLVPWSDAQLDLLHRKWVGLSKAAWRLPRSFPAAPLTFPSSHGGTPVPHPRVYLVQALATHVEQLVAFPDDLRDRAIRQYRLLCSDTGCLTVPELIDFLSRERTPRPCPIARLLRVCGQLDLPVKLPDCLSLGPGEHETSWHRLLTCLREHVATQPSNAATRKDLEMVEAKWRDIRLAFKAKGLLQPRALILDTGASHPQWCELAFSTPWLRPFHRLLQLIPVEARTRLFPPLDRGRRLVAEELHRGLISDTLKALQESRDPVGALVTEDIVGIFRDPRWTKVKCSERPSAWGRLLSRLGLESSLTRALASLHSDLFLAECPDIIRDICALGLSGLTSRRTLTRLLHCIANHLTSPKGPSSTDDAMRDAHPFMGEQACLSRDFISIETEDPPECIIEAPPYRVITRHNKCKVTREAGDACPQIHVGTVTQGRFLRLCSLFGQEKVLTSLSGWIQQAEQTEATHGVASAQFWSKLRQATGATGYIGGPPLLLPPYFARAMPSDDDRLKDPPPAGVHRPAQGRYIVDFLHRDANFQARMRVLLANPGRSEFLVLTRPSTLEKDTTAMLSRRFTQIHTIIKGCYVAAKKGNWSRGAFHAIQSLQDWTLWAPKQLESSIREDWRLAISGLTFSREGIVAFDPTCPSLEETKLGASGSLYTRGGVLAATDGSVKKDGCMGASVCWSKPELASFQCEVHGPPKSIAPELVGIAAAPMLAPLEEDLTILTDSKSSLLQLKGMQRGDFPIFLHRRAERRLLENAVRALNYRAAAGAHTHLVKVTAHAGDPLNTVADFLAGRAIGQDPSLTNLDSDTVYFYLHGRAVVWGSKLREHLCVVAAEKCFGQFRLRKFSRDEPSTGLLPDQPVATLQMNYTESWLAREGQGRSILGKLLRGMVASSSKRRILQTIANTFPCRANLHKWDRADSARCILCNADSESLCHIQCLCPQLQAARIAAHHQIARCLWSEISQRQRASGNYFSMVIETQIDEIPYISSIPTALAASWRRLWASFFSSAGAPPGPPPTDMARLRPDAVAFRWDKRRMYLLEVTRCYDSRVRFASRPDLTQKMAKYQAVANLFMSVARQWQVTVIPFTIGIRGSIDVNKWTHHLATLGVVHSDIPRVLDTVMASALSALDLVYDARSHALRDAPPPA